MDLLIRIKRLALQHAIMFTEKAVFESELDDLTEDDVIESILNAGFVRSKRSTARKRRRPGEMVHIIEGFTFDGILIYTKGVIRRIDECDIFYVLVSAKRNTLGGQK